MHYPPEVDVKEPFILLVHQGMVEDIFIEDMRERGVEVTRSSPFARYSVGSDLKAPIEIVCNDTSSGSEKFLKAKYLVGCDGARSLVRSSIPGAEMVGDSSRAPWGVLDGMFRVYHFLENGDNSTESRLQVSLRQTSQIFGAKWLFIRRRKGLYFAFQEKET